MPLGRMLTAVALLAGLAACSDSLGPNEQGRVQVAFRVLSQSGNGGGPLVISGSNGTLTITDISLIVNEFELEVDEDACEVEGAEDEECEEFEAPAAFVRLPLDGDALVAVSTMVPAGTYHSVEFEVEDIDLDESDDDAGDINVITTAVRAAFPNWPDEASMVVVGSFTPTGGQPIPFTVFFDAEIEIEKNFVPALVVDQSNETVTIELDPSVWFKRFDGTVLNLSALNGQVVEFEAELEDGFQEIEFDDDD